ncbi:IS30 family transposase [Haloferula sargassicola]|uniref:IS30 family transposase ISPlu1 n=1 Tax=Haloferula sargassicola TaxID=490096 RepID=A0ABP9UQV1_9BACT
MPTYSRLTREQRYTIEAMNRNGSEQKEIAEVIGKHPSTVSRELRRLGEATRYCCVAADRHACSLMGGGKPVDTALLAIAETKLREEQWSPEQISAWMELEGYGSLSHETIYQHIYRDKEQGGDLHAHLRHRCKSYRKRGSERESRGRLKNQVMIDERPKIVDERTRIGDWEMDTVIGKPGGPVLVTMVERVSRYTLMRLATSKEAVAVGAAILSAMRDIREKVLTQTYDNGKEFALHELLAELLEADAYFAHPYHSWERGLNENTNGLIRQYFPKGTDFSMITEEQIAAVETKLNRRPRKCLDFKTPHDIFNSPPPIALAA